MIDLILTITVIIPALTIFSFIVFCNIYKVTKDTIAIMKSNKRIKMDKRIRKYNF